MYRNRLKKYIQFNNVMSLATILVIFVALSLSFDFYYDLNDDVLLKDIVSGAYSGTPDAHSIQMLYPISLIVSLLYKAIPTLPWQGIFLCGCHGVCFYLIAKRSLSMVEKKTTKVALLVTETLLILTLCAWELVIVQYTITAALLAACACFLVFTQDECEIKTEIEDEVGTKEKNIAIFLQQNSIAIILVILAFNIRSEMLLLMSPFIALTGILKWSEEKQIFAVNTIKKYLGLVGVILLGMGISLLADYIAYSGSDWREFRDFFDARTKVYDYTWYPEYEEAEQFYQGIGVTPAKITLIDNYNFGLDESIDSRMLWDIAEYAEATGVKTPLVQRLKEAFIDYKWRTFHEQDAPYNFFVLTAYAMVAALALVFKDKSAVWKLPLMAVFRTIPWMYVILAKRVPNRISHPLYYIEFIVLCAWMLSYYKKNKSVVVSDEKELKRQTGRNRSLMMCIILLCAHCAIQLLPMWQKLDAEMKRRDVVNEVMTEFDAYAKTHPENYYYMDVYSTVDFSEKMFADVDNSQKNYDILGGWASGSPLQKQATANYHKDALSRAELLVLDNFYFVVEEGRDISFLDEFYGTLGIEIEAEIEDVIEGTEKVMVIYRVHGTM